MGKKAKYPSRKLTKEDIQILEQIFLKYIVKFYALTEKYPNPKKYAADVVKKLNSDTNIATLFTTTYAMNSPSDTVFKSGQVNKKLSNGVLNIIGEDYIKSELEEKGKIKKFLRPPDLRKVFDRLENQGIFIRLEGKKEIRHQDHSKRRPGKKRSDDISGDRGGKPSAEILTEQAKKVRKVMEKPEARDFLYMRFINSGLAHKLIKYQLLAFLHAIKMDEKIAHRMKGIGASFIQGKLTEEDTAKFKLLCQGLQLVDDMKLEEIVDNRAKSAIQDRNYYALLSVAEFIKF